MELMTGAGDGSFQQTYQYHKLGCPIAWISGVLNKVSLFKVRLDSASCAACGLCDKACYISTLESSRFSLYEADKERPGEAFACSKCLACVSACPSGSLKYRPGKPAAMR
jgi:polyferredoxin